MIEIWILGRVFCLGFAEIRMQVRKGRAEEGQRGGITVTYPREESNDLYNAMRNCLFVVGGNNLHDCLDLRSLVAVAFYNLVKASGCG